MWIADDSHEMPNLIFLEKYKKKKKKKIDVVCCNVISALRVNDKLLVYNYKQQI